tara:strand:+ start:256 stop:1140 length:885 start_codon:yes stop_codon:yes gene_type:complete
MSKFNLRYVTCVEPPRQGNALLVDYLREYFQEEWHYCEFYTSCISAPCKCEGNNTIFQRNHDFELELDNEPDSFYLIQLRHPLHSIVSHYERRLEIGVYGDDTFDVWVAHSIDWLRFFQAFVGKWLINNPHKNFQLVRYEDILSDTINAIDSVIQFCAPDHKPDQQRLKTLKESVFVKQIREPRDFKYFDPLQFALMELEILNILSFLDYKPQFVPEVKTDRNKLPKSFQLTDYAEQYYLERLMLVEPALPRRTLWNTQTQLNRVIDNLNEKIERLQNINAGILKENLSLKKII